MRVLSSLVAAGMAHLWAVRIEDNADTPEKRLPLCKLLETRQAIWEHCHVAGASVIFSAYLSRYCLAARERGGGRWGGRNRSPSLSLFPVHSSDSGGNRGSSKMILVVVVVATAVAAAAAKGAAAAAAWAAAVGPSMENQSLTCRKCLISLPNAGRKCRK